MTDEQILQLLNFAINNFETFINLLKKLPEKFQHALLVRLSDTINMFGKTIKEHRKCKVFLNKIELLLYYATMIGNALINSRNDQIKHNSAGIYEKIENIYAKLEKLINSHNKKPHDKLSLTDIFGESPEKYLISLGVNEKSMPSVLSF